MTDFAMHPAIARLTPPEYAVGESPVWRAAEGALYWVDITGRRILRLGLDSGALDAWPTEEMPACIAFAADGSLVAGMESGIFALRLGAAGAVRAERLAAPEFPMPQMRFNDGRCDRQGRFWAGIMHRDIPAAHRVGAVFRYDAENGLSASIVDGLITQNGLGFSPDGRVMYLSDSHPQVRCIWAFDYDIDTGTPRNRRVFVDMNRQPGRPDGAAVDADGCYWSCATDAGLLLRFTPAGALDRSIPLPVRKPAMCAFGGARMDTLFVTSIRPAKATDLEGQPLAGAVFALHPGVTGIAETPFSI